MVHPLCLPMPSTSAGTTHSLHSSPSPLWINQSGCTQGLTRHYGSWREDPHTHRIAHPRQHLAWGFHSLWIFIYWREQSEELFHAHSLFLWARVGRVHFHTPSKSQSAIRRRSMAIQEVEIKDKAGWGLPLKEVKRIQSGEIPWCFTSALR